MENCIFCKIVRGEIPSEKVFEDENVLVFKDIEPMADIHLLAIPKAHYADIGEFAAEELSCAGEYLKTVTEVAKSQTAKFGGEYRLLFNTGENAGQSVFHVHGHILSGMDALPGF